MKKTPSFVSGLIVCGVSFAFACTLNAQITSRTAKVTKIEGTARYSQNGGTDWAPVAVGAVLREGSVLQTDVKEGTYIDLVLGEGTVVASRAAVSPNGPTIKGTSGVGINGSGGGTHAAAGNTDVVRVFKDTVISIDKLTTTTTGAGAQTETQLDLRKGHITGNVKKMVAGSTYEIKYPQGVAGIRGSVYDMTVSQQQALAAGVQAGTIKVVCTLNMITGSAVLSFVQDGQTLAQATTVVIQPGTGFSTDLTPAQLANNPTAVPLDAATIAAVTDILDQIGVTGTLGITIVAGNQTIIQQVTTTTGR